MAQSTPLIPIATVDPVTFYFPLSRSVNVALHFFDVAGAVIAFSAGGSRDLLGVLPTASFEGAVSDPTPIDTLDWRPPVAVATITIPGGGFDEFALGAGAAALTLTPSGGSDPAGAVSYRISVSGAQTRVQS